MRDIKFRAWTGSIMEHNVTVGKFGSFYVNPGPNQDGLDEKDSASLTPFNTKYPDNTPVMQYSGLKDKNGKEIYEGDIVRNWQGGWNIVVYKAPSFEATVSADQSSMYRLDWWEQTEVIGNIYEHPHLIAN